MEITNYTLGEIFYIIRNRVFEMSLVELENLICYNEERCSYSKWQRLEKGEFGLNFKQKPLRAIEEWSKMIISATENTAIVDGNLSSPINYKKRLFVELLSTLKQSQYNEYIHSYNFETINTKNITDMVRFITCIFIIFSGNHGKYYAGNDANPTTIEGNREAPFINKVGTKMIDLRFPEIVISGFDFRFLSPNTKSMPSDSAHTLEHHFSYYIRQKTGDLIDVSIMGCGTGFLMYFAGDKELSWVSELFFESLQYVLKSKEIPKATPDVCWNFQNHDLDGAKMWANRFLSGYY
jgi:S-ribosylhomocysteine lyase